MTEIDSVVLLVPIVIFAVGMVCMLTCVGITCFMMRRRRLERERELARAERARLAAENGNPENAGVAAPTGGDGGGLIYNPDASNAATSNPANQRPTTVILINGRQIPHNAIVGTNHSGVQPIIITPGPQPRYQGLAEGEVLVIPVADLPDEDFIAGTPSNATPTAAAAASITPLMAATLLGIRLVDERDGSSTPTDAPSARVGENSNVAGSTPSRQPVLQQGHPMAYASPLSIHPTSLPPGVTLVSTINPNGTTTITVTRTRAAVAAAAAALAASRQVGGTNGTAAGNVPNPNSSAAASRERRRPSSAPQSRPSPRILKDAEWHLHPYHGVNASQHGQGGVVDVGKMLRGKGGATRGHPQAARCRRGSVSGRMSLRTREGGRPAIHHEASRSMRAPHNAVGSFTAKKPSARNFLSSEAVSSWKREPHDRELEEEDSDGSTSRDGLLVSENVGGGHRCYSLPRLVPKPLARGESIPTMSSGAGQYLLPSASSHNNMASRSFSLLANNNNTSMSRIASVAYAENILNPDLSASRDAEVQVDDPDSPVFQITTVVDDEGENDSVPRAEAAPLPPPEFFPPEVLLSRSRGHLLVENASRCLDESVNEARSDGYPYGAAERGEAQKEAAKTGGVSAAVARGLQSLFGRSTIFSPSGTTSPADVRPEDENRGEQVVSGIRGTPVAGLNTESYSHGGSIAELSIGHMACPTARRAPSEEYGVRVEATRHSRNRRGSAAPLSHGEIFLDERGRVRGGATTSEVPSPFSAILRPPVLSSPKGFFRSMATRLGHSFTSLFNVSTDRPLFSLPTRGQVGYSEVTCSGDMERADEVSVAGSRPHREGSGDETSPDTYPTPTYHGVFSPPPSLKSPPPALNATTPCSPLSAKESEVIQASVHIVDDGEEAIDPCVLEEFTEMRLQAMAALSKVQNQPNSGDNTNKSAVGLSVFPEQQQPTFLSALVNNRIVRSRLGIAPDQPVGYTAKRIAALAAEQVLVAAKKAGAVGGAATISVTVSPSIVTRASLPNTTRDAALPAGGSSSCGSIPSRRGPVFGPGSSSITRVPAAHTSAPGAFNNNNSTENHPLALNPSPLASPVGPAPIAHRALANTSRTIEINAFALSSPSPEASTATSRAAALRPETASVPIDAVSVNTDTRPCITTIPVGTGGSQREGGYWNALDILPGNSRAASQVFACPSMGTEPILLATEQLRSHACSTQPVVISGQPLPPHEPRDSSSGSSSSPAPSSPFGFTTTRPASAETALNPLAGRENIRVNEEGSSAVPFFCSGVPSYMPTTEALASQRDQRINKQQQPDGELPALFQMIDPCADTNMGTAAAESDKSRSRRDSFLKRQQNQNGESEVGVEGSRRENPFQTQKTTVAEAPTGLRYRTVNANDDDVSPSVTPALGFAIVLGSDQSVLGNGNNPRLDLNHQQQQTASIYGRRSSHSAEEAREQQQSLARRVNDVASAASASGVPSALPQIRGCPTATGGCETWVVKPSLSLAATLSNSQGLSVSPRVTNKEGTPRKQTASANGVLAGLLPAPLNVNKEINRRNSRLGTEREIGDEPSDCGHERESHTPITMGPFTPGGDPHQPAEGKEQCESLQPQPLTSVPSSRTAVVGTPPPVGMVSSISQSVVAAVSASPSP